LRSHKEKLRKLLDSGHGKAAVAATISLKAKINELFEKKLSAKTLPNSAVRKNTFGTPAV
jgi:hypothetical protein